MSDDGAGNADDGNARIRFERGDDGVAVVSLAHPPLNIYDLAMRDELIDVFAALGADSEIGAVVLRADGRHFSAGADLGEFGTARSILAARRIRWRRDPWTPLLALAQPVVVALHGYALGAGLEMPLLCDVRLAAPDTVVGLPETKLGMLPSAGGTQSLTRAIGPARALPVVLGAANVDADEALRLGIVHRLEHDVDGAALELAARLVRRSDAARAAKRALRAAWDLPLAEGLRTERRLAWAQAGASAAQVPDSDAQGSSPSG